MLSAVERARVRAASCKLQISYGCVMMRPAAVRNSIRQVATIIIIAPWRERKSSPEQILPSNGSREINYPPPPSPAPLRSAPPRRTPHVSSRLRCAIRVGRFRRRIHIKLTISQRTGEIGGWGWGGGGGGGRGEDVRAPHSSGDGVKQQAEAGEADQRANILFHQAPPCGLADFPHTHRRPEER